MLLRFMSEFSAYILFCEFYGFSSHIRSLIYFEFTFVYGVRKCSNLIILHVAVQFSHHHLLKRLTFLHCAFLPPLLQIN